MNKLARVGAAAVVCGVATWGSFEIDQSLSEGVNDSAFECYSLEQENEQDCIDDVYRNAGSYPLIQFAELGGIAGLLACGYIGYRELRREQ